MLFDISASEKNWLDSRLSICPTLEVYRLVSYDSTNMRVSGLLTYLYVADFSILVSALIVALLWIFFDFQLVLSEPWTPDHISIFQLRAYNSSE